MIIEALLLATAPQCLGIPVDHAVAGYAARIRAMDTAGIAALFGDDGESVVGDKTLTGSKAIAAFFAQFADYRVTAQTMTIDTTTQTAAGWRTDGHFTQRGTLPSGAGYSANGGFSTEWRCDPKAGWRVRRMETTGD